MKPAEIKDTITPELLDRIDIRVGTIERVENVENADLLVRLIVDFGDHRRSILAGLKGERDDPRQIVGRQALFVVNLKPKKMFRELSEGMLFDIGYQDGIRPALAIPDVAVPNGARAG